MIADFWTLTFTHLRGQSFKILNYLLDKRFSIKANSLGNLISIDYQLMRAMYPPNNLHSSAILLETVIFQLIVPLVLEEAHAQVNF